MACRSLNLSLTLGVLGLAACGENTTPTQPVSEDQALAGASVAAAGNFWTAKAPFPIPPREMSPTGREGHTAGVAKNASGKPILYVTAGMSEDGLEFAWGQDAYNPATNTWTRGGPSTQAMWFTNGIGEIGNKLYISGGRGGEYPYLEMTSSFRVYDPVANRSFTKRNMPRPTAEGVTGVINGKLYVLAGVCLANGQEVDCRSLYRYDPVTNAWTALARSPHPHRGGVGGVINGKFYVAGGCCTLSGASTAHLDVYDPASNTWSTLASVPEVRARAAGAVLGGKLYVIGGNGRSGNRAVFAYNPVTNTWQTRARLLRGGTHLAAARVILVDGQARIFTVGFQDTEMYTP
jgi:N-acetylneuraminic acid mutarotase